MDAHHLFAGPADALARIGGLMAALLREPVPVGAAGPALRSG